jgi:hypothetical protein
MQTHSASRTLSVGVEPYIPAPVNNERQDSPPFNSADADVPFDAEQIFQRDVSPDKPTIKPTDRFIRKIIAQEIPELLETRVTKSVEILDSLQATFSRYTAESPDASA